MKRVSQKRWLESETRTLTQVLELYGLPAEPPPPPGMTHVGWLWLHSDGSFGLLKPGEGTSTRGDRPVDLRPLFVATLDADLGMTERVQGSAGAARLLLVP